MGNTPVQGEKGRSTLASLAPFIGQITEKLEKGIYKTEATRCFCGVEPDDIVITTRDRYFIPHRMVMCKACALIRANPRMTAESYEAFYNNEYRPLYDTHQWGEAGSNDTLRFMKQAAGGVDFQGFLAYFGIKPKSVLEIGSSFGGLLASFKELGIPVYGVELDENTRKVSQESGIPTYRSIKGVKDAGIKVDLIVLQDVIEHFLTFDILGELKDLLTPDGVVYINTPGIFHTERLNMLWQNAHTWQFTAETLNFVMSHYGYEALFQDESIDSIWAYDPDIKPIPPPKNWVTYIIEHLQQLPKRRMPPIRAVNKFSSDERMKATDANLALQFPDLAELVKKFSGEAIIIGGGPSVHDKVEEIKQRQAAGAKVFCIERMYPWTATVGIKPDYVVALDGSEDVIEGFTTLQEGVTYLMGASVQPAAMQLLKDQKVYIYSLSNPYQKPQNLWAKHGYERITIVNTGGSVTLACMSLACTLGFRNLHFYGFDLKVTKDRAYAPGIAGQGVPRDYFLVEVNGKEFLTCIAFLSFAQQFFYMVEQLRQGGFVDSIDVHGDSLINNMWDGTYNATQTEATNCSNL